ncbi:hypothetical protein [Modicisalibacter luteus]|uniref:Uncharacterized protein n=1 Tax=Modicisalibacter luteus TaxID=453962 RepID=A0ABV7M3G6_9GAMM|nr:hypothetical protein [Halomonas lutea]GHA84359.1 hypothetical protein GCM10007159_01760 [Halomonas lutea]
MTLLQAIEAIPEENDTSFLQHLDSAVQQLVEKDRFILQESVNERAVTFRLAIYLQERFPDWHVDCEYNCWETSCRAMRQMITATNAAATEARTIYPDIVIHQRGTSRNLAAIEIAKSSSRFGKHQDLKKLRAYKTQMQYQHAVLLNIGVGSEIGNDKVEVVG